MMHIYPSLRNFGSGYVISRFRLVARDLHYEQVQLLFRHGLLTCILCRMSKAEDGRRS